MKIEQLAQVVEESGIFRSGQILAGERNPLSVRRQLDRWERDGRIVQLRRSVYYLAPPYRKEVPHPFVAANVMRRASYVSLHSALSYHGMIPEYVPMTTSVTTGRPEILATPMGRFQFRHVSIGRFFGYEEREIAPGQMALMATPAKALADLLYLTPGGERPDFLGELRLEPPEGYNPGTFEAVAERMASPKVARGMACVLDMWSKETGR